MPEMAKPTGSFSGAMASKARNGKSYDAAGGGRAERTAVRYNLPICMYDAAAWAYSRNGNGSRWKLI